MTKSFREKTIEESEGFGDNTVKIFASEFV